MSGRGAPHRLGRGLASLLGEARAASAETSEILSVPVTDLVPGPFQPRGHANQEQLEELASSIRSRGILQPLLVRPDPAATGRFQIIAGERRWRAAQLAGLHDVPALVRSFADADAMAAALVENLQRADLNVVEEAEGYRRLSDEFGLTQESLAEAVGKSRSHIANTLRLLGLPPTVLGEVRAGALTAGHARALLAHPYPAKAALDVIARGLTVRQTEALCSRPADYRRPRARAHDPEAAAVERQLTAKLGLKVELASRGQGGTLHIHYRDLDQLDGLLTLLNA